VQGDEPHGCGERLKGPRMALVSRPPEQRRREGSLAAGQTRMPGALSLWLLSLSREQRESDSPCKAKSVVSAEEGVAIQILCFGCKRGLSPIAPSICDSPLQPPSWRHEQTNHLLGRAKTCSNQTLETHQWGATNGTRWSGSTGCPWSVSSR